MNKENAFLNRFAARVFAVLVAAVCVIGFAAPSFFAEGELTADDAADFCAAVADASTSTIKIDKALCPVLELSSQVNIDRAISIDGQGAVLSILEGGKLKVAKGATLTLTNITLSCDCDYAVSSDGVVILGGSVTIGGTYGVLLNAGASLTSNGEQVNVADSVSRAFAVYAAGGNVTVSNVAVVQQSGDADIIYVHSSTGKILFGSNVTISAAHGNAVVCPADGECPDIEVGVSSQLNISAPDAGNTAGERYYGAAVDIRNGNLTLGAGSAANIRGSSNAIIARNLTINDNAGITIACTQTGSSASSGTSNAALWVGENMTTGSGVVIDMMTSPIPCNGIYAGNGIIIGEKSKVSICGNGNQFAAVCTPEAVALANDSELSIRSVKNAIICDHGMTTGSRCSVSIADAADYGIRATGTLQAEKLYFGEDNTIKIVAGYSAIYTRESVNISGGSVVGLTAGSRAPALWIDAANDSQGHLTIAGSQVSVSCSAGSKAAHNSAVYVVGAITIDEQSEVEVLNDGDFGVISTYGDINIGNGSSLYTSGGCGIYLLSGNLRLTQGGALYAEGKLDSGARVEHGVLNAGDGTIMDIQGARFGVEVLGDGGVWLSAVEDFDIRSTAERAVYIQNGTFNLSGVERLSAWKRDSTGGNSSRWWVADMSGVRSWEIKEKLSDEAKLYADYTMLSPQGVQQYKDGSEAESTGFEWYNGSFVMSDYSRLGMYRSRPTARPNYFFIPAGRSFSWWLLGETYTNDELTFELVTKAGDGEFVLDKDGRFTYSAPNYSRGNQSFSFKVIDRDGVESEEAAVTVNVTASKPPIVCSDTYISKQSEDVMGRLEMYDYDGGIAATEVVSKPEHGTLILSSDGQFSYTPEIFFSGLDTFAYYATDNMGDKSNIGYVTIAVGDAGRYIAPYDTIITEVDTPASMRLSIIDTASSGVADVSSTDATAANGQEEYVLEITRQPEYGTLEFTDTETVEYTPFEDFSGSDTFSYRAVFPDGTASNEALITVAIIPNQRPAVISASYSCIRGMRCKGVLRGDDADGSVMGFRLASQPEDGSLTMTETNGEFTYQAALTGADVQTFRFTALDNDGLSSHEGTIEIDIVSVPEYLRRTGKMKTALVAAACILISLLVLLGLLISRISYKRKERRLEKERENIMNMIDDGDDDAYIYDDYEGHNRDSNFRLK